MTNKIIIDHIKKLEIDSSNNNFFVMRNTSLQTKAGLEELFTLMSGANLKENAPMHGILNLYDWYSITLNKYVLLIQKVFELDCNYRNTVMPFCKQWRNKVAAHYSYADPKGDNTAMQRHSVFQGISHKGGGWIVGGSKFQVRLEGGIIEEASFPEWNLVEEHKKIRQRFWP